MKVSKSLLNSIMVGVALSTATSSCQQIFNPVNAQKGHDETCGESCDIDHGDQASPDWENCPGCGMG